MLSLIVDQPTGQVKAAEQSGLKSPGVRTATVTARIWESAPKNKCNYKFYIKVLIRILVPSTSLRSGISEKKGNTYIYVEQDCYIKEIPFRFRFQFQRGVKAIFCWVLLVNANISSYQSPSGRHYCALQTSFNALPFETHDPIALTVCSLGCIILYYKPIQISPLWPGRKAVKSAMGRISCPDFAMTRDLHRLSDEIQQALWHRAQWGGPQKEICLKRQFCLKLRWLSSDTDGHIEVSLGGEDQGGLRDAAPDGLKIMRVLVRA
ncbi:hypothetical protein B0H14DRAFT_2573698 [Mycena olivaceomarginata]|nr:hypothetical protein B0H14DRAFT_2576521 [Mycena olivaceomarginata]KAJ7865923.1 hypothetical protein B0H14DRAFT_2573698 [Mycena olivaceomarginata]